MNGMEWNDLRIILAIGREGSLAGAARTIRNDHSTVFRKLNAIETRTGVRFFERIKGRYAITEAGEATMRLAEKMENEILALERQLIGRDTRLQGNIRVAASEGPVAIFLPPLLAEFRRNNPDVTLELISEFGPSDLSRREADVALRITKNPPDSSLGRYICDFAICAYASPEYLERAGERALVDYEWVVFQPTVHWHIPSIFTSEEAVKNRTAVATNSVQAATAAAREGMGVVAMSAFLADAEPGLVRIGGPFPEITLQMWLLTHPDLRKTARVIALMDFLARRLRREKAQFEGALPSA
jgi:DNA-binding transcriptional LysR family regulator